MKESANSKFNPVNLILLFVSGIGERFIYYGFRSFFILYLVSNDGGFGLSDVDASTTYRFLLITITIGLILAGPLLDFVIPKKISLPIGFTIIGAGLLLCLSNSMTMLSAGLVFMSIGSALTRVSFFTKLDALTERIPKRRNLAFIAFVPLFTTFVFLAPIAIGAIARDYSFKTAILTTAFLCLVFGVMSFFIKRNFTKDKPEKEGQKTPQRLGLVLLAAILGSAFWLSYDLNYTSLFNQVMISFEETTSAIPQFTRNSFFSLSGIILIILGLIFMVVFLIVPKAPVLKLIALSTLLMIIAYRFFYLISPLDIGEGSHIFGLLAIMTISGIAEVLFEPLLNSYVLKTAPKKYKATLFSVFLFATASTAFATVWLEGYIDTDYAILLFSLPTLFLATALFFVDKEVKRRNTSPVFPPLHPQE